MPILYALSGPDIGKTYTLDDGAILGRAVECEGVLRGKSISRRHARLEREGDSWVLVDLGSRNGLHVDGEKVQRIALREGGTFYVGELELRFREEAQGVRLVREAKPPASEPQVQPALEIHGDPVADDGISFEGEDLFDTAPAPAAAASAPTAPNRPARQRQALRPEAGTNRQAERLAAAGIRPSGAQKSPPVGGRPVLQYSKAQASDGFFSNDLGQYPLGVRLAAGVLAVLVFVGLFYVAYLGAHNLKSRGAGSSAGQAADEQL